jgi:hypothetical protein
LLKQRYQGGFQLTNNTDIKKIGVIVGREWSWPPAFIEEVNRRNAGVVAEYVKLGGTKMNEPNPYAVIIDRISHEIPYYRAYLKNASLQGTIVVNNPFWWSADDKFTGASIADRLGIPHPKTVALPSHSYIEGVVQESLRNLAYPIPWEEHIEYLGGFPVILKPAWGGGFKKVYKLNNFEELFRAYNETGTECMMLQQYIEWEKYARCICLGQEDILTIKFDANAPWPHRYFVDHEFLTAEEGRLVTEYALKLNRALGYDMNTVEFAIKDGVPYAIDFTNPAPDFDVVSLTEHYFPWVVNKMADLCIDLALGKRKQERIEPRWDRLLEAGMSPIGGETVGIAAPGKSRSRKSAPAAEAEKPATTRSRRTASTDEQPAAEAAPKKRSRKKSEQSAAVGGIDNESDQVTS